MLKILLAGGAYEGIEVGLSRLGLSTAALLEDDTLPDLEQFAAVYFSGVFPTRSEMSEQAARALCKRCAELSIPVVFDPCLDSPIGEVPPDKRHIICETAALGVVFVPSLEEGKILCGKDDPADIARHFLELGASKVVVKLDKKGAYYQSAKEFGYAPTFRADNVVDTRGAGNAFSSGLISGIVEEIPLSEAVVRANACGCIAIQTEGELDCLPTGNKLREYMLNHRFKDAGSDE